MKAYKLPNGKILIPKRATDDEDKIIGDGMIEVSPGDPEAKKWIEWYDRTGEEMPTKGNQR